MGNKTAAGSKIGVKGLLLHRVNEHDQTPCLKRMTVAAYYPEDRTVRVTAGIHF